MRKFFSFIIVFVLILNINAWADNNKTENNRSPEELIKTIHLQKDTNLKYDNAAYQRLKSIAIRFEMDGIQKELQDVTEMGLQRIKTLSDFIKKYNDSTASVMAYYYYTVVLDEFFTGNNKGLKTQILSNIVKNYPGRFEAIVASIELKRYLMLQETDVNQQKAHLVAYKNALETFLAFIAKDRKSSGTDLEIICLAWFKEEPEPLEIAYDLVIELELGKTYALLGEKEQAIQIYNKVIQEYPETVYSKEATTRLKLLK